MSGREKPNIVIIGGGISGLAAGCYARMNGFAATIIEMHDKPGGCCTSWDRRGYTFDPCISWLNGSGNDHGDELSQVWRELNAFDGKTISQVSVFNTVRFPDGTDIQFYCDPDILEPHLLAISPEDEIHIRKYCRYVRDFRKCSRHFPFLKAQGLRNFRDKARVMLKLLPFMKTFSQTMAISVEQFASQFQHPKLREAFRYVLFDAIKGIPLLPSCINVANAADNNAGVPAEGSLSVAQSLEERYLQLGGEIRYRSQVREIEVRDNRVKGVRLGSGETLDAGIVIGASDGYNQIYNLLGGRYTSDAIDKSYACFDDSPEDVFPGTVCMFLGLKADYTHLPAFSTYILDADERARLPGLGESGISVQVRNRLFPGCAPEGKSVIYVSFLSDFRFWEALDQHGQQPGAEHEKAEKGSGSRYTKRKRSLEYRQTKLRLAKEIIACLDARHPGLSGQIEYTDLATPLTCVRYTGNRHGSIFGWTPLTQNNDQIEAEIARFKGKLPGLQGFYMAGHWLGNGGVTRAAHSGRHAVQYICSDLNMPFVVQPKSTCAPPIIRNLT
ncbi:MAG TPA: FAD-dependent oxidoreductase [Burkholderiaceae bacterium]